MTEDFLDQFSTFFHYILNTFSYRVCKSLFQLLCVCLLCVCVYVCISSSALLPCARVCVGVCVGVACLFLLFFTGYVNLSLLLSFSFCVYILYVRTAGVCMCCMCCMSALHVLVCVSVVFCCTFHLTTRISVALSLLCLSTCRLYVLVLFYYWILHFIVYTFIHFWISFLSQLRLLSQSTCLKATTTFWWPAPSPLLSLVLVFCTNKTNSQRRLPTRYVKDIIRNIIRIHIHIHSLCTLLSVYMCRICAHIYLFECGIYSQFICVSCPI